MSQVLHLIEIIDDIDTCIDQRQIGTQLHVAGVQHIGQQGHFILVTVIGYSIISFASSHCSPVYAGL